jgi:hypothetical protein
VEERERRVLSSVSPSAVPLLFFVNTLARSLSLLAKSASVSDQVNRFSNPNYAFSFRLSLSIRSLSLPTSHDSNYLRARVY